MDDAAAAAGCLPAAAHADGAEDLDESTSVRAGREI